MKITESEWKHILIRLVFENYEQFEKLYAVFMAMKNIFRKLKFRKLMLQDLKVHHAEKIDVS